MDELREKIARLPTWARGYIKQLETAREPLLEEAASARRKMQQAVDREKHWRSLYDAMCQLLTCAERGGHPDAAEYVRYIYAEYGPQPEEAENKKDKE